MKLVKDTSVGAQNVSVLCVSDRHKGNRLTRLNRVCADTEGRAFVDYYCDDCLSQVGLSAEYVDGVKVQS